MNSLRRTLLVWLLATRRHRAFLASVAMSAVFVLLPFANAGMHALRIYPQLLRTLTSVYGASSFSLLAVCESFMSSHSAQTATLVGAVEVASAERE